MTDICDPLAGSVAKNLLMDVAASLCDRPGENAAQRKSRTRDMIHNTLGFRPRDGLEYMLSTMVVGHFELIMDSMHDVFQRQFDTPKDRIKSGIVTLDRSMIALLRELRSARKRPLAKWAEDGLATADAEAVAPSPQPTADVPPEPMPEPMAEPVPEQPPAAVTPPEPANPEPIAAEARPEPLPASRSATSPEPDDGTTEEHVAAFLEALASMAATLEEARAADIAQPENGDKGDHPPSRNHRAPAMTA